MLIRKISLTLIGMIALNFFAIGSALAHAELTSATPAADELVTQWPKSVTLQFNEDLITAGDQQVNVISVTDAGGQQIDNLDSKVTGNRVEVSLLSDQLPGSYFVNYRVVSADGHVLEDSYEFIYEAEVEPVAIAEISGIETVTETEEQSRSSFTILLPLISAAAFVVLLLQIRKNRNR